MTTTHSIVDELIDGWEYWCPDKGCRNRTFSVASESDKYRYGTDGDDDRHLQVRVLKCARCFSALVIGTYTYYNNQVGWAARGQRWTSAESKILSLGAGISSSRPPKHPTEYVAFLEPAETRELPKGLSKNVVTSFREAEFAVSKNKPISAAATIRNTVRLIVEDNDLDARNLKDAIKSLPFDKEYRDAISDLKIVGDDTMHYEGYSMAELRAALEVLALALGEHARRRENIEKLRKAVGTKRSEKGKAAKALKTQVAE